MPIPKLMSNVMDVDSGEESLIEALEHYFMEMKIAKCTDKRINLFSSRSYVQGFNTFKVAVSELDDDFDTSTSSIEDYRNNKVSAYKAMVFNTSNGLLDFTISESGVSEVNGDRLCKRIDSLKDGYLRDIVSRTDEGKAVRKGSGHISSLDRMDLISYVKDEFSLLKENLFAVSIIHYTCFERPVIHCIPGVVTDPVLSNKCLVIAFRLQ